MPIPESRTPILKAPASSSLAKIETCPPGPVNLTAFDRRLIRIWRR
jgi:hypothetical protein